MKHVNIKARIWWLRDKNVKYYFPLDVEAHSFFKEVSAVNDATKC